MGVLGVHFILRPDLIQKLNFENVFGAKFSVHELSLGVQNFSKIEIISFGVATKKISKNAKYHGAVSSVYSIFDSDLLEK